MMRRYICKQPGCPFGTDETNVMEQHLLVPHNGPTCPCPFINCPKSFSNWEETSAHLYKDHSISERTEDNRVVWSHGCLPYRSFFTCPICNVEVITKWNGVKIGDHCQKHTFAELLAAVAPLIDASIFARGTTLVLRHSPYVLCKASRRQIFTFLTLTADETKQVKSLGDIDRFAMERGITEL